LQLHFQAEGQETTFVLKMKANIPVLDYTEVRGCKKQGSKPSHKWTTSSEKRWTCLSTQSRQRQKEVIC